MIVQYKEWKCKLEINKYQDNGRMALSLVGAETDEENGIYGGEPIADCSVNIPEAQLADNEICVPEYKYAGMMAALIDAGIAEDTGRNVPTGYVTCPVLTISIPEEPEEPENPENPEDKAKELACEGERAEQNESMFDSMIHELVSGLSKFDKEKIDKADNLIREGQSLIQEVMKENFPDSWLNEREKKKNLESV